MVDERKIATITLAFCFVVLGVRLASADVVYVDSVFYAGDVPAESVKVCNCLVCVQPVSYPTFYSISSYVEARDSSIKSYTIHLNEGWNLISTPLEVSQ